MSKLEREWCLTALTKVPDKALADLVNEFPKDWIVQPTAVPQAGLGMMQLRDSALGEAFYIGEIPIAQCSVSITTPQGIEARGGAVIMHDQIERAQRLAFCDAVLSGRLPGWEKVVNAVKMGEQIIRQVAADRKAILAKTRVDFSLLDDVAGE